ncbi:hypothetical protein BV510_18145 [Mycolicibacterium diernhoferi]|uniref:Uncharacterized protein n=1 Tax=Mycolicibacterium diernhoferi TaxID=1801 RepID=A0A1T3WEF1_9MYCO|nr:hypothetical protein BV510_18145 [Mycolicibacterium diernhoferi]
MSAGGCQAAQQRGRCPVRCRRPRPRSGSRPRPGPRWTAIRRSAGSGATAPDLTLFGMRLNWLLLAVLPYPLLYGVGRLYVRLAEQGEKDFVRVVDSEP